MATRTRTSGQMLSLELTDFSGGLNTRDAQNNLAPNETPDCMNVTFDERGGVGKRLGYKRDNSSSILSDIPNNVFYWQTAGQLILQIGARLWKRTSANSYTEIERAAGADAFTTTARATFADFNGALYALHPADGVLKYTGSGNIAVVNATVKGQAIAVWKNKLWAGGPDSSSANPTRVWFSNTGNGDTWTTASDFVDIRDIGDDPVTALGLGQGLDTGAVPISGLLVFKRNSTHRVQDPTTGAYTTLSSEAGAAGPLAVTSLHDLTCMVNDKGVWVTNGEEPPVNVSGKIETVFEPTALNLGQMTKWAMGTVHDRIVMSLTENGQTANNFSLEYHPAVGWFAAHDFAFHAYALNRNNTADLYALTTATNPNLVQVFTGGKDDVLSDGSGGSGISCRWQSSWFVPANHKKCRFRRTRLHGRGTFDFFIRLDYNLGTDHIHHISLDSAATALWDSGYLWDNGALWGPTAYQNHHDMYSHGVAMAISFEMRETSGATKSSREPLGMLPAATVGNAAIYSICLDYVPLGYA